MTKYIYAIPLKLIVWPESKCAFSVSGEHASCVDAQSVLAYVQTGGGILHDTKLKCTITNQNGYAERGDYKIV